MSISWMHELGPILKDDTHIVLPREQFERITLYNSIGQPTSPSIGRVFRTKGGLVVEVEPDDQGRPDYVLRHGRVPLFLDA